MTLRTRSLDWCLALSIAVLTVFAGCTDDGLGKRYSVTGMVSYNGKPVEKGLISFISTAPDGRASTGNIENGYYTLTTQDPNDGAFPGQYTVTVAARTLDLVAAGEKAKAKGNTSGYIPQDFTAEASKKSKNAVPDKYGVPTTSPLKAEVKAQSNKLDFNLVD